MQETTTVVGPIDGIRLRVTMWDAESAGAPLDRRGAPLLRRRPKSGLVWREFAGARFEVVHSSGHLPHLEEPNALAALAANFFDGSLPSKCGA